MTTHRACFYLDRIDAVIFGTDGVVTDTAHSHAVAWQSTFDDFLRDYGRANKVELPPFDLRADYVRYIEGRSRLDAVRAFLASRGIMLPDQSKRSRTVESLADEKTRRFSADIARYGVAAFPSSVALLRELRNRGVATAAVSTSRSCREVLRAANVEDLFDVRVDGTDAERQHLAAFPEPDLYIEAARRLQVRMSRCALVEDALNGVEAGHRIALGVIVGVDRYEDELCGEMYERGANVVVASLADISVVAPHASLTPK